MADPVHTLEPAFRAALAAAFGPEHANADPALRRSDRADYQANAALGLRKQIGGNPREIAEKIVKHLDLKGVAEKVEVAGAGFINVTLAGSFLATCVSEVAADERLGVAPRAAETVAIDYSSPNIAKEMHVGHLRSTILGDALARVLEAVGDKVVRQNHLGDWGTPFGMLLEHLLDAGGTAESFSVGDLNAFYQEARRKFEADPAFADRARRRVVELQGGDEATLALWRRFVTESRRYLETIYAKLDVTLKDSDVVGESFYNPMLAGVVAELTAKGLAVESDGALCVFPPGFTGREGEPLPLIVRKQDGGYGYGTTDLAAVRYRTGTLGATRIVYVVGSPQSQHLAMVFKVGELAGWLVPGKSRAEHVAFGSILGPDKKMFKTRSGETVRLVELLDEAVQRARDVIAQKNPELDAATRENVARAVGIGAVKYADLSSDRIKDYVFDWDRMLAFEGNTAPYLQYAHARIRSIFRRAEAKSTGTIVIAAPAERALAMAILGFGEVVHEVAGTLQPHRLCTYLFTLAAAFSTFYEQCPVLKAATDEERASRLALCDLTARVLARGLDLLGIEAPQEM
ncbi:MAG TPA: arginine--tRNA ligase [Polyangiaceae bacterium]|jgi:arginyl-tRNA synthetase